MGSRESRIEAKGLMVAAGSGVNLPIVLGCFALIGQILWWIG